MGTLPGSGDATSHHNRNRFGFRSDYEIFSPMSEWQQDEESYTLTIYLPGFVKEQLKAETDRNIIRVRGERLVAGNKRNRLMEEFQIPGNCETKSIHAKFQRGVLTITLPRKNAGMFGVQEAVVPSETTRINGQNQAARQKEPTDTEPQRGQGGIPSHVTPAIGGGKLTDEKSPRRLEWKNEEKAKSIDGQKQSAPQKKPSDTKTQQGRDDNVPPNFGPATSSGKLMELGEESEKMGRKSGAGNAEKPEKSPGKLSTDAETVTKKNGNKEFVEGRESKEKQRIDPTAIDQGVIKFEKYMTRVKGLAKCKEEKLGLAVLVIVALGAFIFYTLKSEKDNLLQLEI